MAAVERKRFDLRDAELAVPQRIERIARFVRNRPIANAADRQMPAPAALFALESVFSRHSLHPRRKGSERARFDTVQSHPNRSWMLEVGKSADAHRCDLKWRRLRRELTEAAGELLQAMRIYRRSEKLERDMQICARHPSHTVVRMPQLVDRLCDRVLDLIVHAHCDERAHSFGLTIP